MTAGEALRNTSPWSVPPLIPLAIASDPMEVLFSVYPVARWKAGATCSCITFCNEPADNTSTGPEGRGEAAAESGPGVVTTERPSDTTAATAVHRRAAPDLGREYRVDMPTR